MNSPQHPFRAPYTSFEGMAGFADYDAMTPEARARVRQGAERCAAWADAQERDAYARFLAGEVAPAKPVAKAKPKSKAKTKQKKRRKHCLRDIG